MNKTSRIDLAGVFKHRANRILASFWEKQRLPRFVHERIFPTHYQTSSTRKNWLSCIQNTLLAFCHTGPTKRIEKKSGRIEKAGRIKIYTGTGCDSQITIPPTFHPHPTYIWYCDQTWFLSFSGSHKFFYRRNKHENNYKVDYQRLEDLSWDTICVKSINL